MSTFKADIRAAFYGKLSTEMQEPVLLEPITQQDVEEVKLLREDTPVPVEGATPYLENDVNDVLSVTSAVDSAVTALNNVKDASPVDLPATVAIANGQLADAARVLGVDVPAAIEVNADTHELDVISMEGAFDWLIKVVRAIAQAGRKCKDRLSIWLRRMGDISTALNGRISKCYTMVARRKNAEGGTPIKINVKYLKQLVLENEICPLNKLVDELKDLSQFSLDAGLVYGDYSAKEIGEINVELTTAIANSSFTQPYVPFDLTAQINKVIEVGKRNEMYLGNIVPQYKHTKMALPEIFLGQSTPRPENVAAMNPTVPSLSNNEVKDLLAGISKVIGSTHGALENWIDELDTTLYTLLDTINTVSNNALRPVVVSNSNVGTAINVAGIASGLGVSSRLAKVQSRLEGDLYTISESVQGLYDTAFARLSAALVLVEESLLQD